MGRKKVGIAMSKANKTISTPMKVLLRGKEFHCNLKKILVDYEISGILIGLPLNDDYNNNKMYQSIIDISKNFGCSVAIDDYNTLVIGEYDSNGNNGKIHVFKLLFIK